MIARGLDRDERAVRQLDYELEVIGRLTGFEAYFLAVAQVVADTRALGIRSPRADPAPAAWSTTWLRISLLAPAERVLWPRVAISGAGCERLDWPHFGASRARPRGDGLSGQNSDCSRR